MPGGRTLIEGGAAWKKRVGRMLDKKTSFSSRGECNLQFPFLQACTRDDKTPLETRTKEFRNYWNTCPPPPPSSSLPLYRCSTSSRASSRRGAAFRPLCFPSVTFQFDGAKRGYAAGARGRDRNANSQQVPSSADRARNIGNLESSFSPQRRQQVLSVALL